MSNENALRVSKLIRRIRNYDKEAFGELLEVFQRMIYKIIYSFNLDNGDFRVDENDLFQEACLALYDAVFTYEEDRNVQFLTYAYMVIRSRISTQLRCLSRSQGEDLVSLDNRLDHSLKFAVSEDPVQYHQDEILKEKYERFLITLNEEDRRILELRDEDLSYKQIAEELHISVKKVDNRLRNMKKRFKRFIM